MTDELFIDGGKIVKMEVDYSDTVTEKLPVCEKLAKVRKIEWSCLYGLFLFWNLIPSFVGWEAQWGAGNFALVGEANTNCKFSGICSG